MQANQTIPMIHMSAVSAPMDMLDALGVPLAPGLVAANMPTRIVDERDGYVPFRAACTWFDRAGRDQGIDNFGLRSALSAGPAMLADSLRDTLVAAPTLYKGICTWADLIHRESSHAAIWVDDSGEDLRLRFSSTFAQDVPGQSDWIWFACALHLTVARLFLGPDWTPAEITVPMHGGGLELARELLPDTRLRRDPKLTGLTIPRELLSAAPLAVAGATARGGALPTPPDTLESSLAELVRLYLPDGVPRIEVAAEAAGMSVRTLQRRLAGQSLSYDQLVSKLRFEQACRLLQHPELNINDIARQLGYRHATHFTRAFRRIAGVSPRDYRRSSRH